jgi:molybdopterin converting factor small subunit
MRLLIRYFQPYDQLVGLKEESLDVPDDATTRDLLRILVNRHPRLADYISFDSDEKQMRRLVVVQRDEFLKLEDRLAEDEVLILYPISGG